MLAKIQQVWFYEDHKQRTDFIFLWQNFQKWMDKTTYGDKTNMLDIFYIV